jgi:RimJ/RimL family protein N-acetyltransferase
VKPYLETDRLFLREFVPGDEHLLLELDSDPQVMRYLTFGKPSTLEEVRAGLERGLALYKKHQGRFGVWAAIEKSSGAFIGWFHFRPAKSAPENLKRIELGYRLKRIFWGQGYATEMSRALIAQGFQKLDVEEVFAITMKENLASQAVMKKCGLNFVREFYNPEHPETQEIDVEYVLPKGSVNKFYLSGKL